MQRYRFDVERTDGSVRRGLQAAFLWLPLLCLWTATAPVLADQRDPRLDELFESLRSAGSLDEASQAEAEIWRIWNTPADESLVELMREGSELLQKEEWSQAVAVFTKVVERDPGFAEGWNKRATAYYNLPDYEASIRDVARVLDLEPRHFAALSGMGLIYRELGADAPAMRWFERALAINPYMANVSEQIELLRKRIYSGEI